VKKTQPSAAEATAIKAFLNWILTTGDSSKNLDTVGFLALPSGTQSVASTLVNSISG
jgi:ABC-type phosphate transport system substrate-binding protein